MSDRSRDSWTLDDLRREFERYSALVNAADLAPSSKSTYLTHADRFVRWLAGEVDIAPAAKQVPPDEHPEEGLIKIEETGASLPEAQRVPSTGR